MMAAVLRARQSGAAVRIVRALWLTAMGGVLALPVLAADVPLPARAPGAAPAPARLQVPAPMQTFESNTLARIVASQRGHPFWLVLWDLDCPYCVKSMKNLAAAQQRHPGLRVVTVATDSIADAPALRQRLQEIGISGPAYAFGDEQTDILRYAIDPAWRGEKPRAYYYSAQGVRQGLSGVLDAARIDGV